MHFFNPAFHDRITWASDQIEIHVLKDGSRVITGYRGKLGFAEEMIHKSESFLSLSMPLKFIFQMIRTMIVLKFLSALIENPSLYTEQGVLVQKIILPISLFFQRQGEVETEQIICYRFSQLDSLNAIFYSWELLAQLQECTSLQAFQRN